MVKIGFKLWSDEFNEMDPSDDYTKDCVEVTTAKSILKLIKKKKTADYEFNLIKREANQLKELQFSMGFDKTMCEVKLKPLLSFLNIDSIIRLVLINPSSNSEEIDLEFVKIFPNLYEIELDNFILKEKNSKKIGALKLAKSDAKNLNFYLENLIFLNLWNCKMEGMHFKDFEFCNLRYLELGEIKGNLELICHLPNQLEYLKLDDFVYDELLNLRIKNLKCLDVITIKGLKFCENFKSLEYIKIKSKSNLNTDIFKNLEKLKFLQIRIKSDLNLDLINIENLKHLRYFKLEYLDFNRESKEKFFDKNNFFKKIFNPTPTIKTCIEDYDKKYIFLMNELKVCDAHEVIENLEVCMEIKNKMNEILRKKQKNSRYIDVDSFEY
ncbi:unnamed protein product [Brachionus calyciflorus]|uniref:Uncharacterized protein n=1 Tax=Brachionus calyciflorus TaxID=104777 RepID=A0A814A441_9BILA|nr:unnamed protein product [Brachionus calyciflorus]